MHRKIHRLVDEPARLGKPVRDQLLQSPARGRTASLEQKAQSLTAIGLRLPGQFAQKIQRHLASHRVAVFEESHRPIRIVQIEKGSLRIMVRRPIAVRVQGIAFDFRRATIVGLHHQRDGALARRHGGREELRRAVHIIFRRLAEGQDIFLRATATAQTKAGEQKGGGHDFHEVPARDRVGQFAGSGRELPLHPLLKLGCVGQLLQAAPILGACLRLGAWWGDGFAHR